MHTYKKQPESPESKPRAVSLFHIVSLPRVLRMLLHQETTSWFEPPEWGGRLQGVISPQLLPHLTRLCGSNLWSLTMYTTSMYPWSHFALWTWTPPHHRAQVTVRTSDSIKVLVAIRFYPSSSRHTQQGFCILKFSEVDLLFSLYRFSWWVGIQTFSRGPNGSNWTNRIYWANTGCWQPGVVFNYNIFDVIRRKYKEQRTQ